MAQENLHTSIKSFHDFNYYCKKIDFKIVDLNFKFTILDNLDQTIDDLCKALERNGGDPLGEDYCPYFGVLWPSAVGLSQYIYKNQHLFKNKKTLEIGSGLSLPSFVLAKLGHEVVASDFHRDVPSFLNENFTNNEVDFNFLNLNWRIQNENIKKFDFVIGSDILYEGRHPFEVCQALVKYLAPNGRIILSDPGRTYIQKFVSAMNELGFKEELFPESVNLEGEKKDIFVFEFKFS
jgi:predicted nicotinamide N-methyase